MEEAWEFAVVSQEDASSLVPRIVGCNRSPDFVELTVSDGRVLAIPLTSFPTLEKATEEEWQQGEILPFGEGVNWANLDVVIRAKNEFFFEQDFEKLKPYAISRKDLLNLEIKQPNNFILSEREHRYASDAIDAFSRGEANTSLYIAACFAPVLLMFSLLQGRTSLGFDLVEISGLSAIICLSISGVFFGYYRAVLSAKRAYIEGYRLGLLSSYFVEVFPRKKTLWMNSACLLFFVPFGYLLIALTLVLLVL